MEIEENQAHLIDHFVKQVSSGTDHTPSSLANLIVEATSHSSLFAFSEILALPNLLQLHGTEYSGYIDVLRLFAHGRWRDYKSNAGLLPLLVPDQILKLKQLSVLTLAETNKVLAYDLLLEELDISNVRELEDFLINECIYAGIVKGKLDQKQRRFEVQFAAGRDLRPGQLDNMIQTLGNWLENSDNVLLTIQEKIKWAETKSVSDTKHQEEVKERVEEVKKSLSHKGYNGNRPLGKMMCSESDEEMEFYEHDRIQPKRRRPPRHFYGLKP
ncbi:COP9 signalosome complex subunit 7-like [Quercus lobata]|uniref:PCI domain-containing protein n=1 Tax=Quercus lobata TaxID=97700 RepID=A0A7N2REA2_QUELO|nr:COP9 signalosome complex subunit 7-like [Quercus lobata]XP_030945222.1 COP9 signalosome complex subunit 7-like [Quercus lobata]XP_030945223.1 COP9 signalosome complex subunit 7-like [Quercus lobata]